MREDRNIYRNTAYINDRYERIGDAVEVTLFSFSTFEIEQEIIFEWVKKNPAIKLELYRGLSDKDSPVNICGSVTNIRINPLDFKVTGTLRPEGRMRKILEDTINRHQPVTINMRGIFDFRHSVYRCTEIKGLVLMSDFSAYRKRSI